jgi:hypothetical protein
MNQRLLCAVVTNVVCAVGRAGCVQQDIPRRWSMPQACQTSYLKGRLRDDGRKKQRRWDISNLHIQTGCLVAALMLTKAMTNISPVVG